MKVKQDESPDLSAIDLMKSDKIVEGVGRKLHYHIKLNDQWKECEQKRKCRHTHWHKFSGKKNIHEVGKEG